MAESAGPRSGGVAALVEAESAPLADREEPAGTVDGRAAQVLGDQAEADFGPPNASHRAAVIGSNFVLNLQWSYRDSNPDLTHAMNHSAAR